MGFEAFAAVASLAATAFGAVESSKAADDQAEAFQRQGALSLEASEEQAKAALELAEIEAALLRRGGQSAQEIAQFNAALALQNAAMEEQAGLTALSQARRTGAARVSSMVAGFAAQGRLLDDTTPNLVIAEGFSELAKDLDTIQLNTDSRAARERGQANLFTLQGQRERELSEARALSRRRVRQIDADSLRRTGSISQATSLTNAAGAEARSTGALIGGIADFGKGVSSYARNFPE